MKNIKVIFTLFLCLFFSQLKAQNTNHCAECNMVIRDNSHKARAEKNGEILNFDSAECLINYLKSYNQNEFSTIEVSDYNTQSFIDAKTAFFLISKSIPSPMGANLTAFSKQEKIKSIINEKGGQLYSWEEIVAKFNNPQEGSTNIIKHDHYRPDAHAPIGVMGDHLHQKGEFMLSLRYMNMFMKGNISRTDNVSDETIYNNYMVAPQKMKMDMYMLGIMYSPSNKLTLVIMQNFLRKNMGLTAKMTVNNMPMLNDFSTESSGLGDLKFGVLYGIFNNHKKSLHFNTSFNIPLGSISQKDDTPMNTNAKLPYSMQLGSGTFDIIFGATYKEIYTNTSWGTQVLGTFRVGDNNENYHLGNIYELNFWGAYKLSQNFSLSARILGISEGEIKGVDTELNPMMVPTSNTKNYGSEKIKSFFGVNISFPASSSLNNFRFGAEVGTPIYEHYNGIQMNENLTINFGLKYNL
jgi:nitrous oxide reductase accessory protein NosL